MKEAVDASSPRTDEPPVKSTVGVEGPSPNRPDSLRSYSHSIDNAAALLQSLQQPETVATSEFAAGDVDASVQQGTEIATPSSAESSITKEREHEKTDDIFSKALAAVKKPNRGDKGVISVAVASNEVVVSSTNTVNNNEDPIPSSSALPPSVQANGTMVNNQHVRQPPITSATTSVSVVLCNGISAKADIFRGCALSTVSKHYGYCRGAWRSVDCSLIVDSYQDNLSTGSNSCSEKRSIPRCTACRSGAHNFARHASAWTKDILQLDFWPNNEWITLAASAAAREVDSKSAKLAAKARLRLQHLSKWLDAESFPVQIIPFETMASSEEEPTPIIAITTSSASPALTASTIASASATAAPTTTATIMTAAASAISSTAPPLTTGPRTATKKELIFCTGVTAAMLGLPASDDNNSCTTITTTTSRSRDSSKESQDIDISSFRRDLDCEVLGLRGVLRHKNCEYFRIAGVNGVKSPLCDMCRSVFRNVKLRLSRQRRGQHHAKEAAAMRRGSGKRTEMIIQDDDTDSGSSSTRIDDSGASSAATQVAAGEGEGVATTSPLSSLQLVTVPSMPSIDHNNPPPTTTMFDLLEASSMEDEAAGRASSSPTMSLSPMTPSSFRFFVPPQLSIELSSDAVASDLVLASAAPTSITTTGNTSGANTSNYVGRDAPIVDINGAELSASIMAATNAATASSVVQSSQAAHKTAATYNNNSKKAAAAPARQAKKPRRKGGASSLTVSSSEKKKKKVKSNHPNAQPKQIPTTSSSASSSSSSSSSSAPPKTRKRSKKSANDITTPPSHEGSILTTTVVVDDIDDESSSLPQQQPLKRRRKTTSGTAREAGGDEEGALVSLPIQPIVSRDVDAIHISGTVHVSTSGAVSSTRRKGAAGGFDVSGKRGKGKERGETKAPKKKREEGQTKAPPLRTRVPTKQRDGRDTVNDNPPQATTSTSADYRDNTAIASIPATTSSSTYEFMIPSSAVHNSNSLSLPVSIPELAAAGSVLAERDLREFQYDQEYYYSSSTTNTSCYLPNTINPPQYGYDGGLRSSSVGYHDQNNNIASAADDVSDVEADVLASLEGGLFFALEDIDDGDDGELQMMVSALVAAAEAEEEAAAAAAVLEDARERAAF